MKNKLWIVFALALVNFYGCNCNNKSILVNDVFLNIPPSVNDKDSLAKQVNQVIQQNIYFKVVNNLEEGYFLSVGLGEDFPNGFLLVGVLGKDHKDLEVSYEKFVPLKESSATNSKELKNAVARLLRRLYFNFLSQGNIVKQEKIVSDYLSAKKNVSKVEVLNAISILGKNKKYPQASNIVEILKRSRDVTVQTAAVRALGQLSYDDAMPYIIEFARRKSPSIRKIAISSAREIGNKLALQWLFVMAYGHFDDSVRQEALKAYRQVRDCLVNNSQ